MKIRHGFVSNSSSSSFVVAFPKTPTSIKETMEMMFPMQDGGNGFECYDNTCKIQDIAKSVFRHIEDQLGTDKGLPDVSDEVKTCLAMGGDVERIMHRFYSDLEGNEDKWWDMEEILESIQRVMLYDDDDHNGDLKEKYPDAELFHFTYSDNDGSFGSIMEHGDIFRHLPHHRESHH